MIKRKVQTILFCRDANKQIQFLLLQTNERRNSFWQNITGSVDPGEDYQDAALREAIEETGIEESNIISLTETNLVFEFDDRWGYHAKEKVFLLQAAQKFSVKIDPSEHQDFKWVPLSKLGRDSVEYESNWIALENAMEGL